jgi:hypothetical protein
MSRLSWEQTWQAADKETNMGLKIIREAGGYHALAGRGDKFWIELGTFSNAWRCATRCRGFPGLATTGPPLMAAGATRIRGRRRVQPAPNLLT